MRKLLLWLIILTSTSASVQAIPVSVELIDCYGICDDAPHSAFTDLIWKGHFVCAFRQGRRHVSTDGRIRVLYSPDAENWRDGALLSLDGYDLRDAHLCLTPDGQFMLVGGACPRKDDNDRSPTGTFVAFSEDGVSWSRPQIVLEPGRWMWQVSWHEGKAYGVSYAAPDRRPWLDLLVSDDGRRFAAHAEKLFGEGYPTETTLRFASDDTCYALVRRDGRDPNTATAMLGDSRPPYKQWRWRDLGEQFTGFGGPNFVHISGNSWIAAGRMHQGGAHTALAHLNVATGEMTKLLKLPSGGDTSYPGLVYVNGLLYVSYYSSHEGKTQIYLAKVKVDLDTMQDETFGAQANSTGQPIGGGAGYSLLVPPINPVSDLDELRQALGKASPGDKVFIDSTAAIDLTGKEPVEVPAGVTLASGRGADGSQGAVILSTDLAASPLLLITGPDVRITGLRLKGPDDQRRTEQMRQLHKEGRYYSIPNSDGIICSHPGLEVDNCEISAFSHAGLFLKKGAIGAHIHHNYMHHNQRSGLGYGVCLNQSDALIEANLFDYCRHHIAGTGRPTTSYEARYNIVLGNANGHSFDMHGGRDRKDGTDIAGDSIIIHHNTFEAKSVPAVVIRGKPRQVCEIHHNEFIHADAAAAIRQTNASGNMEIGENLYGVEAGH